ncbi:MAG: alkaline phosphatase [Cellulomonas sp. 73-145]|mgnify:CR=1 FL=1|uniref:DeoR/GlpR family DNA-binding transcription regulator n=1 Tax=Cellulomonas sp. 73-145 TaxID=1895739 RepID=UPI000928BBF1|nr:DeoR/GlpR family DNA-binding transcription regulator [Cellulomonas sp. 73-145]MBN9325617.1 DeoR/GlpR transcriptional regulator [Cellulomonas sp.]OJV57452.1 MAG: alkaline phosphatase [Cellulomonas sp. 73-145]
MRKSDRLTAILARASETGSVDVTDLAERLGVSGATIRRDLQTLSAQHLLVRTHGGAVAGDTGQELSVRVKETRNQPEKRRIGQAAAALVEDGAVVGLTGGTTATELARALVGRRGITVVTNAINIAAELATRPEITLVVIGGVARPSFEMVGPAAEMMLDNYHLDIAFIGVDGLSAQDGCTTYHEMEAQTDRNFLERARRSVVIADSSKIGRATFARIVPLARVDDVVTDQGADPAQLRELAEAGVRIHTV